jgi:hypothetical protein
VTDQLDLLLESVREDEPTDEAFVQRVMADVRVDETRRTGRRRLRHPMVIGISAAIVVTGGAVAALVGTNPTTDEAAQATRRPAIVVTSQEPEQVAPRATQARPASEPAPESTTTPVGAGYPTDHSSFIVDEETGLMLRTDTHTNAFTTSKPQRVTLTLENTGGYPIALSASQGCALQVMAYGAEDATAPDTSLLTDPDGKFEWVCAGSDADPRSGDGDETWVLAPGERRTADAVLVLPEAGAWKVSGMCRCDYNQVKPTPFETSDPLADLTNRALPSPLLPEQPDGRNLVTPAIGIRAD